MWHLVSSQSYFNGSQLLVTTSKHWIQLCKSHAFLPFWFPIDSVCLHCLYISMCAVDRIQKKLWNPAQYNLKTSKQLAWPKGLFLFLLKSFHFFYDLKKRGEKFSIWTFYRDIQLQSIVFLSLTYLFDWLGLWLQQVFTYLISRQRMAFHGSNEPFPYLDVIQVDSFVNVFMQSVSISI